MSQRSGLADEFGCATIGIQYQQGLKDLAPASDLVEGLLNNVDRPPVHHEVTGRELFAGEALPHFNEVDECAGFDGLITNRVWLELGYPPETTLHDLRWGRHFKNSNDRRVRLGFFNQRRCSARSLHWRVRRDIKRTSTADVFSSGRRYLQGDQQTGLGRLEPCLHLGRATCNLIPA